MKAALLALFNLCTLMVSAPAFAQTGECPAFDVQGQWRNSYGREFRIHQMECDILSLIDRSSWRDHSIVWRFRLDGRTPNRIPQSFAQFQNQRISAYFLSNGEILASAVHPAGSTALGGDELPHVNLTGTTTLSIPGLPGSGLTLRVQSTATLHDDYVANVARHVFEHRQRMTLETTDIQLVSISGIGVLNNENQGFMQGANLVLRLLKNLLTAELVRTL